MQNTCLKLDNNVIYTYDSTFNGFLNCVYESYYKNENPISMISTEEEQTSFIPMKDVYTSRIKATRVQNFIIEKISKQALYMLKICFLSNLENKEVFMLHFIKLGYKVGGNVCTMFGHNDVAPIHNAIKAVNNEAHLFKGFIRFKDYKEMLVCTINPKHNILPVIAKHFSNRYPDENFIIYDNTNKLALIYKDYSYQIISVTHFQEAKVSPEEQKFIDLWKLYLNTVAIKQRQNKKCQLSHMPKRYRTDIDF